MNMRKKFQDFWMKCEREINCGSWMKLWMQYEQNSMNQWSNQGQPWQMCNSELTNQSCAFWQGKTKCSDWLPANRTVINQSI